MKQRKHKGINDNERFELYSLTNQRGQTLSNNVEEKIEL